MKYLLSILCLFIFSINHLYADIIDKIHELRKQSTAINDSTLLSLYENLLILHDLRLEYYESINWYNISNEEKDKVINEHYPLGAIVFNDYSVNDGLEILLIEASALKSSALIYLDIIYKHGIENKIKAFNNEIFNFWLKLSKEGQSNANVYLGIYYFFGLGVEKNYDIAQKYLESSQEYAGISESFYYLGFCYKFNNQIDKAIEQWEMGLLNGHADSGYELGVYYRDNTDYIKAIEYFNQTLAIDEYDIYTNINMSEIYLKGWGVDINPEIAIKYLNKVIELDSNHIKAMINLASAYIMMENYNLATDYYKKVARLGHEGVQEYLIKNNIEW